MVQSALFLSCSRLLGDWPEKQKSAPVLEVLWSDRRRVERGALGGVATGLRWERGISGIPDGTGSARLSRS